MKLYWWYDGYMEDTRLKGLKNTKKKHMLYVSCCKGVVEFKIYKATMY